MRFLLIAAWFAAWFLASLFARNDAEAFLRPAAAYRQPGLGWQIIGGSSVHRENLDRQIRWIADRDANTTTSAEAEGPQTTSNSLDAMCSVLQSSAGANDLPLTFLMHLIWQESRFDAYAISRAGARGISQFMPGTAAWVGLQNPFEVSEAIRKSAELLRDLKKEFGNLGLAAAAYNAGPKRVQDWLANRRSLPAETQAYVRIVTGRTVDDWKSSQSTELSPILGESIPCPLIAKALAGQTTRSARARTPAAMASASLGEPAWGIQLLGNNSKVSVLAAYRELQIRYRGVLGQREPLVIPSRVGRTGYWYRVRVAADSLLEAQRLCSSLREVGGSCLVQHN